IEGEQIQVRARIRALDVYSAHADATGLTNWVTARGPVAGQVFLLHGEPAAREGLRTRLIAAGIKPDLIALPGMDEGYVLTASNAQPAGEAVHRIAARAVAGPDWHNARAGLLIELDQALGAAADDTARERLLANFRKTLATTAAAPPP
ncbi:MAG: MBL fold metallo-hydrolase, partial [Phenylobacterium sp.]|nr:MBL fold metallo-hydrolase [Phenylobacterium sp.]